MATSKVSTERLEEHGWRFSGKFFDDLQIWFRRDNYLLYHNELELVYFRYSSKKRVDWERSGENNKHHLTPRSRGGTSLDSNLLLMDKSRHNAWHLLFGTLTLDEIVALLQRTKILKNHSG